MNWGPDWNWIGYMKSFDDESSGGNGGGGGCGSMVLIWRKNCYNSFEINKRHQQTICSQDWVQLLEA